jgi:hypothetical protein
MPGINGRKNHRRHPGIKGRRPDLKSFRKKEAEERALAYGSLSTTEKLARLPPPPACEKQRTRLLKPNKSAVPIPPK